ncbi:MAG: KUP/HAK/KT family potassium transporter, partial [Antricoccus sp.]
MANPRADSTNQVAAATVVGAIGVVFGDIGTSPLYAVQSAFSIDHAAVSTSASDVMGIASLIFWSVTIVVSFKYVLIVLRADNDGEGGVIALASLAQRALKRNRGHWGRAVIMLGIVAAALFYGDSLITPAISVLSAIEGLEVAAPSVSKYAIWIAIVIIIVLFVVQRWGTHRIGRAFGPIMVLWFLVLVALGLPHIVAAPKVLLAISPTYAFGFIFDHAGIALVAMGAVVLSVTGAEALYADMGHFGQLAIRRSWFFLIFPALIVNYLGQAGLLLEHRSAATNPFFLMAPSGVRLPLVVLATMATVIASQAVITGAFSMTQQAIRSGLMPRLKVKHTSAAAGGQIYMPIVNWLLLGGVLILILIFRSSSRLSSAYGLAVTGTFVLTTILLLTIAHKRWHWPTWRLVVIGVVFGGLESLFLVANLAKIVSGGWLPLVIATVLITVMTTWQRGRDVVTARRTEVEGPLDSFVATLLAEDLQRVPGTAVFLQATPKTTPLALRANVHFNHILHEHTVIISISWVKAPYVLPDEQVTVDDSFSDSGIRLIYVQLGFMDPDGIPQILAYARKNMPIPWSDPRKV